MKLSVVIPARNEAGNIATTLSTLTAVLRRETIDYEVVVVDDGSRDETPELVASAAQDDPRIRLVVNNGLHGFGRAVRTGLDAFSGDAVVIMMADLSDDPEDVVRYHAILQDYECAFGSRWIAGGKTYDYPWLKRVLNRSVNHFIRMLFFIKYNDTTNAFKGYRRCVIEGCQPLLSPHFNLTVEIPLKAMVRGFSYKVMPITWKNRKAGKSAFHLQELGSRYLFIILNVWLERMLTFDDYRRNWEGRDVK